MQRHSTALLSRRGASHPLTIFLQFPILVFLIAFTIEINSISFTQIGLDYTAASTARAASIWLPAEGTTDQRLRRIKQAAVLSMATFATGKDVHLAPFTSNQHAEYLAEQYHDALQVQAETPIPNDWLKNKVRFAYESMKIEIDVYTDFDGLTGETRLADPNQHVIVNYVGTQPNRSIDRDNPDIDVRIEFEKPIDIPGVGLALGSTATWPDAGFYSRKMKAESSSTLEAVKSSNYRLGVQYDVFN